jgi:uncharacterized protein (DUF433 family)
LGKNASLTAQSCYNAPHDCPDVERIQGKVSGAWLVKGTRLSVDAILANADDYTSEEIATEIFQGVTPEVARRIVGFARQHVVTAA